MREPEFGRNRHAVRFSLFVVMKKQRFVRLDGGENIREVALDVGQVHLVQNEKVRIVGVIMCVKDHLKRRLCDVVILGQTVRIA